MENKTFRHLHIYRDYGSIDKQYIEDFEKKYNICLPNTYNELMQKYNGAYLVECDFDFINKNGEEDMRSFLFKAFGKKKPGKELIDDAQFVSKKDYYGVPNLIGIASTAEGDTLCFDYQDNPNTCEPKVVLLVHDEYETYPDGTVHMKVEPIADSFDEFLDMLYEYQDDEE
jgi:hypothetical protein